MADRKQIARQANEAFAGGGGRNTEVVTFDGDKISRVQVYFGWDL
jgi:hypothetical protein